MQVALIGEGYLGSAYKEHMFPDALVYDEPKEHYAGTGNLEAGRIAVNACDLAIIAVPTDYKEDGTLDTSIIEGIVDWCDAETILIKSAVQPGTTDRLVKETGKHIAISVELIGEGNYYQPPHKYPDPKNPKTHQLLVIGGEEPARSRAAEILWEQMSPDIRIHLVTAIEAEITKMAENTYGALKVTWANVLREVCEKYGANFIQVHQAWSEDGRVDPMHTRSVAHNRGWNSKCYNKDVQAFANISGSMMLNGMIWDNIEHLKKNKEQQMVGERNEKDKTN